MAKRLVFLSLAFLLVACQGGEGAATGTAASVTATAAVPTAEPVTEVLPTETAVAPTQTTAPTGIAPPTDISPQPYPLMLPRGTDGVLVYTTYRLQGPHAPPFGELFYVPLDESGQPLGPAQFWLETNFVTGLFPSPNGQLLAVWITDENGDGAWVIDPSSGALPFREDPPVQTALRISFLGWAADSQGVLHSVDGSIVLTGFNTRIVVENPSDYAWASGASLSPDGQLLIYSLFDSQSGKSQDGTWSRNLRTQSTEQLFGYSINRPIWSPNSRWIAFSSGSNLILMQPDGRNMQPVSERFAGYGYSPNWSPNGDALAFMSAANPHSSNARSMIENDLSFSAYISDISDAGASNLRPIMPSTHSGYIDPSWSPDGHYLLVTGGSADNTDIWLVSRDGQTRRQLTSDGVLKRYPVWLKVHQP